MTACLFVICKIEDFSSVLVSRFCYSVCLSIACRSQFQTDRHETFPSFRGRLNWEANWFWGQISEIVIFHPIDLKFERDLHIASLNWETNYFFEVKRQPKVKTSRIIKFSTEKSSNYILLTWKLNIVHHWIGEATIFEVKRSKVNSRSNF